MSVYRTELAVNKISGLLYMVVRALIDKPTFGPSWVILSFSYLDTASLRTRVDLLFRELNRYDRTQRNEHYDLDS